MGAASGFCRLIQGQPSSTMSGVLSIGLCLPVAWSPLPPVEGNTLCLGCPLMPCIFDECHLSLCSLQPALHTAASLAHSNPHQIISLLFLPPSSAPFPPRAKVKVLSMVHTLGNNMA